jgi:methyl-accepting chemotaxis protein
MGKNTFGLRAISEGGRAVAILGVDIDAGTFTMASKGMLQRGIFVLLMGVVFSMLRELYFSWRIISPIKKLIDGTKHIAGGDLDYKVQVPSHDEIGQLAESFNNMTFSLADAREKLHDYFYRMVQAMVRSLEAKDSYTRGHSDRVSEISYAIAVNMGIPLKDAQMLKKAAQMHDIGKLGIHDDILNKRAACRRASGTSCANIRR